MYQDFRKSKGMNAGVGVIKVTKFILLSKMFPIF